MVIQSQILEKIIDDKDENDSIETLDEELTFQDDDERKIIWQAKDFSVREFHTMLKEGDLILQPDYQRKFVMDIKLSSRLIESILMDVPIPVIYLAEEKDEKYSVIDGQQRLTSFVSFLDGKLPNEKEFNLTGLKVLSELNKKTFADLEKKYQSKIKKTTLHTIIIKKESQDDIKFEIFERLNTGSIKLNEDEIRNTVYRGNYIKLLSELENNDIFHKLVRKENQKKRMNYRGMILRFFALSEKTYLNYKPSMKQFCNKELRDNRDMNEDKQKEYSDRFKKCVDLVYTIFGENAFRRYTPGNIEDVNGKWSTNRINMSLFDIQLCGFVNYEKHQIVPKADIIKESLIRLMCTNEVFIDAIETGTSEKAQVQRRSKIWMETLEKIIGEQQNVNRLFSYSVKKQLVESDPTCSICKQQILSIDDAEVDHIMPFSEGGETVLSNAQLTHRYCNRSKNNSYIREKNENVNVFASYQGSTASGKLNKANNSIVYNGTNYESPSAAANKAKIDLGAHENISTNGWIFWKFIDVDGIEKFIDVIRGIND